MLGTAVLRDRAVPAADPGGHAVRAGQRDSIGAQHRRSAGDVLRRRTRTDDTGTRSAAWPPGRACPDGGCGPGPCSRSHRPNSARRRAQTGAPPRSRWLRAAAAGTPNRCCAAAAAAAIGPGRARASAGAALAPADTISVAAATTANSPAATGDRDIDDLTQEVNGGPASAACAERTIFRRQREEEMKSHRRPPPLAHRACLPDRRQAPKTGARVSQNTPSKCGTNARIFIKKLSGIHPQRCARLSADPQGRRALASRPGGELRANFWPGESRPDSARAPRGPGTFAGPQRPRLLLRLDVLVDMKGVIGVIAALDLG